MEIAILVAILVSLVGWIAWARRALAGLVTPPAPKRSLDEHEEAMRGADPFGD